MYISNLPHSFDLIFIQHVKVSMFWGFVWCFSMQKKMCRYFLCFRKGISQNYRWQNRKLWILHRLFLKVGLLQWRMKKVQLWRTLRPPHSPRPGPGRGERVWLEGGPGQYWPPNLILTQSLHLKYTCSKRSVSNSSSLYSLFYSVIYNSVGHILYTDEGVRIHCTQLHVRVSTIAYMYNCTL